MQTSPLTPGILGARLVIYFGCVIGLFYAIVTFTPWASYLPIGGYNLALPGTVQDAFEALGDQGGGLLATQSPLTVALILAASLGGTIVLMIPVTWVYMATKFAEGFRKSFVDALIVLPICATSIVLLIQDSLALAFGLAALVAAVRFRVQLQDALDGIYVFAAICVGLASGVGYLGVAVVMTIFFCFASVILWGMDYGANPVDETRRERKLAKLKRDPANTDTRY